MQQSSSNGWNTRREQHLRTWVVQMARTASLMSRGASLLNRGAAAVTILAQFCTSYTSIVPIATLGCPLVSQSQCVAFMWSALVLSLIGSMLALFSSKFDWNDKAKDLRLGAKDVLELARKIDLQLQREPPVRIDVNDFCDRIATDYDVIMRNVPSVPRFFFKTEDLMNFTLLSAYIDAPNTPEMPPIDDYLAQKLAYEMERLHNHLS